MTDYKTIKGKRVKFFETDLDNEQAEGQLFFSDTDKEMKTVVSSAAWSSSAPLLEGRTVAQGSAGTATAGLVCFGNPASAPYTINETEEYNGSGWAVGGDTTHAASNATAAGTQTAAIAMGISDSPTTVTIKYDGTSWTDSGHAFPGTGGGGVGSGTQTATLYSGQGGGTTSYEYDGSSWTSGGTMNTSRVGEGTGWGPQTSALMCTGRGSPSALTSATEEYNGTSWTSTNNVNAARRRISGSKNSLSQDSGIIFGGSTTSSPNAGATVNTEQYDGSSWTEITNLSTGRNHAGGAGNSTGAWVAGSNPNSTATEEFNVTAATITAGAWASGANYPVTIQDAAGAGPVTASVVWGGYDGPAYDNETFEYDGTSWTESGNMNTARACYQCGTGSQTAALQAGGYATTAHTAASEEYNGTSWSEGNDLNNERYNGTGGGIQTSALMCGGNGNPGNSAIANNESYNGTSWSNETALPEAKAGGKHYSGTSETASLIIGFGPDNNDTLSYDGSSWTDLGHHLVEGKTTGAGGSQQGTTTAALIAGGFDPSPAITAASQIYNGTAWVTAPNLATPRRGGAASGTVASCLAVGGEQPAQSNHTEEFTGETTSLNLKTITDS